MELVPLTTIDRFAFKQVDLIKIDAEGMEMQVLDGAHKTIGRCRPILYIEYLKVNRDALRKCIIKHGYAVHPNNINYLCIPSELSGRVVIRR